MQLQSSLFSRGVLLGLYDFSIQSTVVFLLINFLTSYFCRGLRFFVCKFCRSFRFSPPRGRRSSSSHARKNLRRRMPKCSAEEQLFWQLFWPQSCARGGRQMRKKMRFLKGWRTAISFLCLSVWLVSIFCLRYRHKNKKMRRKIMFYPARIQKLQELLYCRPTRGESPWSALHNLTLMCIQCFSGKTVR